MPSTQVERATRILFVLRTSADNAAASVTLIVRPIASARFVSCKFHALPASLAPKIAGRGGGGDTPCSGRAQRPVSLARKPREINLIRLPIVTVSSTDNELRKICSYFLSFPFFFFSSCSKQLHQNYRTVHAVSVCHPPPSRIKIVRLLGNHDSGANIVRMLFLL